MENRGSSYEPCRSNIILYVVDFPVKLVQPARQKVILHQGDWSFPASPTVKIA